MKGVKSLDITVGNYRIRPYKGLTCWQIEKRAVVKSGATAGQEYWLPAERYPSTIGHACKDVFEFNLRENPEKIDSYKEFMKQINSEIKKFYDQLDDIDKAAKEFAKDKKELQAAEKAVGGLVEIEVDEKPRRRRGRPPKNKK